MDSRLPSKGGGGGGQLSNGTVAGEALEDMSLSSASSVERGDTSEDFLEDVDSGADTFSDGDTADTKTGSSTQLRLRSFLNETMEWSNLDAAGTILAYKDMLYIFFSKIIFVICSS